ncbi:MAG: hypothetical protein IJ424_06270, partial [Oscillospiraceae bacterium]|nr:hypothetical protein [Oscillospiraceae bacterium]
PKPRTEKRKLRLSPNKAQTEKENPCYHLSGVALLPNSYQMITKKGYSIPLVKSDPFPYLALFGSSIIAQNRRNYNKSQRKFTMFTKKSVHKMILTDGQQSVI